MKKFIDISKYSPLGLLEELSENIHKGKINIACVDKEKRRISYVHRMGFKDIAEAVFDEEDRFEFYYEEAVSEDESANNETNNNETDNKTNNEQLA